MSKHFTILDFSVGGRARAIENATVLATDFTVEIALILESPMEVGLWPVVGESFYICMNLSRCCKWTFDFRLPNRPLCNRLKVFEVIGDLCFEMSVKLVRRFLT